MRCQKGMYNEAIRCPNEATQVCDVPVIGESVCYCDDHVKAEPTGVNDWYALTPERAIEEEKADETTKQVIRDMHVRWDKKR